MKGCENSEKSLEDIPYEESNASVGLNDNVDNIQQLKLKYSWKTMRSRMLLLEIMS
jgi:hypothetical protein